MKMLITDIGDSISIALLVLACILELLWLLHARLHFLLLDNE